MEKKQTAVDYLVEQLFKIRNNTTEVKETNINSIIAQAKQMEKEQIMEAVYDSMGTNFDPNMGRAELYYKEKYENG